MLSEKVYRCSLFENLKTMFLTEVNKTILSCGICILFLKYGYLAALKFSDSFFARILKVKSIIVQVLNCETPND